VGGGRAFGKGKREQIWWKYFEFMHENGKVRPVETVLRRGGRDIKEKYGGIACKIYCKHFSKGHNVPLVQL
jgi:hypothetical protein